MKTYLSKNNRLFRLVKIENEAPETYNGKYYAVIMWIDTEIKETYPFEKIEPYLTFNK